MEPASEGNASDAVRRRSIAAVVAVALLLLGNYWLYETRDVLLGRQVPLDFHAYYLAGVAYARDLNPYLDNSRAHEELEAARGWKVGYSSYLYPPTLLPFYAALSRLEAATAAMLWTLASLALFAAAALAAALDRGGTRTLHVAGTVLILSLLSRPLVVHVQRGQIDLALASLSVLALVAYRRNYQWTAALLLAIAAVAKIAPAVLLLAFVLPHRDWRFGLRFAAASAGLLIGSLTVVPASLYAFYVVEVMPWLSAGETSFQSQTLQRFAADAGPLAVYAVTLAGIFGIIWWGTRPAPEHGAESAGPSWAWQLFLANTLVMLIVSAIAWYTAFVWTLIPLAVVLADRGRLAWRHADLALVASAVLLHARIEQHIPILSDANLIGAILCLASLVWIRAIETTEGQ